MVDLSFITGAGVGILVALIPQIFDLWKSNLARKHAIADARNERVRLAGAAFIEAVGTTMAILDELEIYIEAPSAYLRERNEAEKMSARLREAQKVMNEQAAIISVDVPQAWSITALPGDLVPILVEIELFLEFPEKEALRKTSEYQGIEQRRRAAKDVLFQIQRTFSKAISYQLT